jgi:hypothetical protein
MPRLGSDDRAALRGFGFDTRGRLRPNPPRTAKEIAVGLAPSAAWAAVTHLTNLGYISESEGGYVLTVKGIDELEVMNGWRLEA